MADGTTGRNMTGQLLSNFLGSNLHGELESLGENHPMAPQLLLLSSQRHWLDLVLLSLSHCQPMVPRLLLLSNFPTSKLVERLKTLSQSHPMVPQLLLLSPLLHWLDLALLSMSHCHPMIPRLLLLSNFPGSKLSR